MWEILVYRVQAELGKPQGKTNGSASEKRPLDIELAFEIVEQQNTSLLWSCFHIAGGFWERL